MVLHFIFPQLNPFTHERNAHAPPSAGKNTPDATHAVVIFFAIRLAMMVQFISISLIIYHVI
jgi:hypothetical protein